MKHLFILVMLSLLSACDTNHDKDLPPGTIKNIGIYKPEVNKHPKYWATFNGFIDPKLENKVPLKIYATYLSTNKECQYVDNPLRGAYVDRIELLKGVMQPDKNGKFTYKIPIDLYKPGFCKWRIEYIGFQDNNYFPAGDSNVIAYINERDLLDPNQTTKEYNLVCDTSNLSEHPRPCGRVRYFDRLNLKLNKNYMFTLNLKKKQ